jgi:hypothetical protein
MSGTTAIQMRDSKITPDWIARMIQRNPFRKGEDEGIFVTCPVRLAFVYVINPQTQKRDDGTEYQSYNATLLLPPGGMEQVEKVLYPAWYQTCREKFPRNFGQDGTPFGLHWPFHDCIEHQNYAGYTPGLRYIACASQYKPQICDSGYNPIVDANRVYPGVWAICELNLYTYDNKKKGAGFGLRNIMIVADDTRLAGGGTDPAKSFAGVQVEASYDPAIAFAAGAPGAAPPPPGSILPPATPVAPPPAPGHVAAPPAYAAPPAVPGQWAPPAPASTLGYDPIND